MPTTSEDLMLAILSMDAYNRGAGAGMIVDGTSIGGAALGINSDEMANALSSGFFAQEYSLAGKTVISYRGTTFSGLPDGADVLNGWTLSGGLSGADQTQLAKDFYTLVTGNEIYGAAVPN